MFCRHLREEMKGATWALLMLCALFGAVAVLAALSPHTAVAQNEAGENAAGAGDAAAGGGAGATGGTGTTSTPEKAPPSLLSFFFGALGWEYSIPFTIMSFTMVALIVMNILTARRDNMVPIHLVEGFEAHLNEKRYQEAYEMAKNDESFLGQVLSAGLGKLSAGYPQAIEAMQEVGEEENMKLEHRLSYLALIGSLAPMLGLFGTVDGMIRSFRVIANSETTPKANKLAEGISTALVTTIVGLAIAMPAIAAFGILKNRFARLVLEIGILSEGLMSRFQNVGQKKT